jgi:hypothetical protein
MEISWRAEKQWSVCVLDGDSHGNGKKQPPSHVAGAESLDAHATPEIREVGMSTRPTRKRRYAPGHMILPDQRDKIMIPVHMALAAFEHGSGNADHYNTLVLFTNMAGEMALRMRSDPITRVVMEDGRLAMVSVGKRFFATDRFGLSGPEMIAMRECVDLGDKLLKRANSSIFMAVCAAVDEHLRAAA